MSERQFQLVMRKGPQPGKIFPLLADSVTIGRDPMADISINDPEVSRQHARLTRSGDGYLLEDLNSTNGTFIEGDQLASNEPMPVHPSQIIDMGSGVTLLFESLHAVEEETPEPEDEIEINPFTAVSPPADETEAEVAEPFASAFSDELENAPIVPDQGPDQEPAPPQLSPSAPPQRPPTAADEPQTPLVVSENSKDAAKQRRTVTMAALGVLLLCCLCLAFLLSAYFFWGDPLMQALGVY